ncbi:MAG: selenocysteine-specific translation elongation factor [Gemmatimonadales bacterium]
MILGTAGHIDHGKTALVKALTGVDTDRLPEEKRRGITIELGFAPLALDSPSFSGTMGVVDVPGHEAFVRTMLAGAAGIDLALLVIAADEGVMPQTREHLAILGLLRIAAGVVALTKSDLVESEWLRLVEDDVRDLLRGSPLEGAAIVACSSVTGDGLEALRSALSDAAAAVATRDVHDLPRLPIDRAFSVRGTGTVVTGTLWSGALKREMAVRLHPPGREARIRALESHGASIEQALPGSRVAVALGGIDRDDVSRGAVLVADGDPWFPSSVVRADVALLEGEAPLGVRTRVRFHLGTVELGARLVSATGPVAPGDVAPVRVALDEPIVARAGDRFVLRSTTPSRTIGGGIVTDPRPPARRAKAWPAAHATAATRLGWIVDESGGEGLDVRDVPVRVGGTPASCAHLVAEVIGVKRVRDRLYSEALAKAVGARILAQVRAAHAAHPLEAGLSLQHVRASARVSAEFFEAVLHDLVARGDVSAQGGIVALAGWRPAAGGANAARLEQLAAALEAAGAEPPAVGELTRTFGAEVPALLRVLERSKRVVAVAADRYYSVVAAEALVTKLRAAAGDGAPRTASQLKDALGLTRKYLIPFLEYCDRSGVCVRTGDLRVVRSARVDTVI